MSRLDAGRQRDLRGCGARHSTRAAGRRLSRLCAAVAVLPYARAFGPRLREGGQPECQSTCSPAWRCLPHRLLPSALAHLSASQRTVLALASARALPPLSCCSGFPPPWLVRRRVRISAPPL